MNYYKLGSSAMDGNSLESTFNVRLRDKLFCHSCNKLLTNTSCIDVVLAENPYNYPLDVASGIGIIRKDLVEAIGYEVFINNMMIGKVFYPAGTCHEKFFTFRGRKIINIFSDKFDKVKKCSVCGRLSVFPLGKYYMLRTDFEGTQLFECYFHGLVISENILNKINNFKWRKISIMKLEITDQPPEGCEEIPSFYRQGTMANAASVTIQAGETMLKAKNRTPSLEDFLEHLIANKPTFHCFNPADNSEEIGFSITVENYMNDGATKDDIVLLRSLLKEDYEEIETFYKIHNGIRLYCQNGSPAVELFSIEDWEEKTADARSWFEGYDEDDLFDFQKYGIAIGEVSDSANYFIFYKGKVYYSEHDGGSDEIGDSFTEFVDRFTENPAEVLREFGSDSRFSDGKTKIQWIPKKYTEG